MSPALACPAIAVASQRALNQRAQLSSHVLPQRQSMVTLLRMVSRPTLGLCFTGSRRPRLGRHCRANNSAVVEGQYVFSNTPFLIRGTIYEQYRPDQSTPI